MLLRMRTRSRRRASSRRLLGSAARAVARGNTTPQPYRPGNPLTRCKHRLAKVCLALVRRIAQHAPYRRALPAATALAGRDSLVVQYASNRTNAETLNAVEFKNPLYN